MLIDNFIHDLKTYTLKKNFVFKDSDENITSSQKESFLESFNSHQNIQVVILDSIKKEFAEIFSPLISSTRKLVSLGLKSVSFEIVSILLKNISDTIQAIELQELDKKATIAACEFIKRKEKITVLSIRNFSSEALIHTLEELQDCEHLDTLRLFGFTSFPIEKALSLLNSMHIKKLYVNKDFDRKALEDLKQKLKISVELLELSQTGSIPLRDQKNSWHDKTDSNKHLTSPQPKKLERSSSNHSSPSPTHRSTTHSSPGNNNNRHNENDSSPRGKYTVPQNSSDCYIPQEKKLRGNDCRTPSDSLSYRNEDKKRYNEDRHHGNAKDSDDDDKHRSAKKRDHDDKELLDRNSPSKNSSNIHSSPVMRTEKNDRSNQINAKSPNHHSQNSPASRHNKSTTPSLSPVVSRNDDPSKLHTSQSGSTSRHSGDNQKTLKKDMNSSQEHISFHTNSTSMESGSLTRQPKTNSLASTDMKTTSTTAMIIAKTTSTATPLELQASSSQTMAVSATTPMEMTTSAQATNVIPDDTQQAINNMALRLVQTSAENKLLADENKLLQEINNQQLSILKMLTDKISKQSDIQSRKALQSDVTNSPIVNGHVSSSTRSTWPNPSLPSLNSIMAAQGKKQKTSHPEKVKFFTEEESAFLRPLIQGVQ